MAAIIPANVTLNQATGHLIIDWTDGRSCRYPVSRLRLACPCVECRGGHARMGREYDPEKLVDLIPDRDYQIERLEIVGNYALQFYWNDGHHTGIYTWDYLYRLCPTEESNA